MRIEEKIISNGHGSLPNPQFIVIHETANPGASALNHVNYWRNDPTYAVHYVMDWSQIAYHCVPDNRLCWQVGGGNDKVIGIELCHATNKADFEKVWAAGIEWAAFMLKKRNWGVDKLISHDDARRMWGGTDHTDPIGYFKQYGYTWDEFRNEVKKLLVKGELEMTAKEMNELVNKIVAALPVKVWGYRNKGLEKGDTYQILRDCRDGIGRIEKQLAEIGEKL